MIAYKTLRKTGTGTLTYNELDIGGSGATDDFNGYRINATDNDVDVTLPRVSQCEGKIIHFVTMNPSALSVQIIGAGTDKIVMNGAEAAAILNTSDLGQVYLRCDGFRWFAHTDGSFF